MIENEKIFVNNPTPTIQEEVLTLRIENEQLKEQLKNNFYVQLLQKEKAEMAEDFCRKLEKMKPYCKKLCKNYVRTGYMGNDCVNGTCRNCNKWELIE